MLRLWAEQEVPLEEAESESMSLKVKCGRAAQAAKAARASMVEVAAVVVTVATALPPPKTAWRGLAVRVDRLLERLEQMVSLAQTLAPHPSP
jgi:hypothetical protein